MSMYRKVSEYLKQWKDSKYRKPLIFLGFPIWYYGAPLIITSFLKEYDLTGKKIALFATSGGSDIGKTAQKLKPYIGEAVLTVLTF